MGAATIEAQSGLEPPHWSLAVFLSPVLLVTMMSDGLLREPRKYNGLEMFITIVCDWVAFRTGTKTVTGTGI
jgi:hypothetical protein